MDLDPRELALARRGGEFAARSGLTVADCPHLGSTDADAVLRRTWLAAFLRASPPPAGTVDHDDGAHR